MAEVRVLTIDGDPWFVAADVCKALTLRDTTSALKMVDDEDKQSFRRSEAPQLMQGFDKRVNVVNLVSESGLYSLIFQSNKSEAKRFKRWVTAEVLPTIRKTGGKGYLNPRVDFTDPDNIQLILDNWKADRAKLEVAEKRIEDDAPKVLVAEEFFESDGLMGLREAARSFSIPQNTFAAMIREWNWMDQYGTAAKSYAIKQGYMENKVFVAKYGDQKITGKFTRRGIERISQRLRNLAA